jgi:hypothetical protein
MKTIQKEIILKKIEELKKEVETLNKEDKTILVPDCIKIENGFVGGGDGLGIVFPNNKQTLFYHDDYEVFQVRVSCLRDFVQCKLVPCKYKDIEDGDTFYANYDLLKLSSEFENIIFYYKKLKEKDRAVCVTEENDISNDINMHNYKYFWKVEEVLG